jgi:hypothetical protein
MTTQTADTRRGCDRTTAVTRTLLGYGVIAGPIYVAVSLIQAFTRTGFDPSRHEWSLLANGPLGWIQMANLTLAGAMSVCFAVGLRRALGTGRAAIWAPRLISVYGVCLVVAGVCTADPSLGFPPGTAAGPGPVSWHGMVHLAAGGIGFGCLAAACFVLARRFADEHRARFTVASRVVGVVFLLGFGAVASGHAGTVGNLAFTAAIVTVWGWLSAVAADRYSTLSV